MMTIKLFDSKFTSVSDLLVCHAGSHIVSFPTHKGRPQLEMLQPWICSRVAILCATSQ